MTYKPHYPPHLTRRANYYESGPFDRLAELRGDLENLMSRFAGDTSVVVPVWRSHSLVQGIPGGDAPPEAVFLAPDHPVLAETETIIFLGARDEVAHFAVDLSHHEVPPLDDVGHFMDLRACGQIMDHHQGSILAYARGLVHWHRRHGFCGVCGAPTVSDKAGHVRKCTNSDCAAQHFPRTDAAVIMLVHDGNDRILLGRQPIWPHGMHSVLAGFLEPGESLEDAVAREVYEEVGVVVKDVAYQSSQPWPFPASVMLGFTAEATTYDIKVDEEEIEFARWFSREEVLASPEDESFRLPRRDSIARRLINDWLGEDANKLPPQSVHLPWPKPVLT